MVNKDLKEVVNQDIDMNLELKTNENYHDQDKSQTIENNNTAINTNQNLDLNNDRSQLNDNSQSEQFKIIPQVIQETEPRDIQDNKQQEYNQNDNSQ